MTPCILHKNRPWKNGYCYVQSGGRGPGRKARLAHRVAWEKVHGPIPPGHDVHHKCRVRRCVNVDHLELLTKAGHSALHHAEVTHCPRGHRYTPANTRLKRHPKGYLCRECRTCHRDAERERKRKVRV